MGNHDVLWMGCSFRFHGLHRSGFKITPSNTKSRLSETAYGINLRPLALFAQENYKFSKRFSLKQPTGSMETQDTALFSKMYQAVCMIQFKLEDKLSKTSEYPWPIGCY
jgi:fructose-1,6-bisphosphatase-3